MKNSLLVVILTLLLAATSSYASSTQQLTSMSFQPDTLFAYMANAVEPMDAYINLKDELGEHIVANIDPATIQVNVDLIPSWFELIIDSIGFSPDRLQLTIPVIDLIDHYSPFYDLSTQPLSVAGIYNDSISFQFDIDILLRGHASGDLNRDNSIDIIDIMLLVGWLFDSTELPFADPSQADMNKDGSTNTTDLVKLIRDIFYK